MTIRCLLCGVPFGCITPLQLHKVAEGFCSDCIDEQVNDLEALHRLRPTGDVLTEVASEKGTQKRAVSQGCGVFAAAHVDAGSWSEDGGRRELPPA